MEEAAVHLVQRLLSLRETRVPGRRKHRVEDFRRRVSVVRRSAASDLVQGLPQNLVSSFPLHQVFGPFRSSNPSDLVHESPQNLVSSFPLHQIFGHFRSSNPLDLVQRLPQSLDLSFPLHQVFGVQFSVYDVTWCFTPRNPLFLRPEAPRLQVRMSRCRHGRGASLPAIPCFFVWKHHVPRSGWADAGMDVVLHSPQSLIPSSRSTTSSGPDGPMPTWTWCSIPRNPLFLRPEAPRPQVRMGRCRHGRSASLPAIPCFFVWKHHVHRSGWADAGMDLVHESPQSLVLPFPLHQVPGPGWDWKRKCGRICHSTALPSTSVLYRQKKKRRHRTATFSS